MKKDTKIVTIIIIVLVVFITSIDIMTKGKITGLIGSVNPMNLLSSDVPYTNNGQSTVQGAIDDLYNKANNYSLSPKCTGDSCPFCVRAKELSKLYNIDVYANLNKNDYITIGNLGTKGTLSTGDAFLCDINQDKVYNNSTERFYYVTDLEENSNYAVLIFHSNIDQYGSESRNINVAYGNYANLSNIDDAESQYCVDYHNDNDCFSPTLSTFKFGNWSNGNDDSHWLYKDDFDLKDKNGNVISHINTKNNKTGLRKKAMNFRLLRISEIVNVCNMTWNGDGYVSNDFDTCSFLADGSSQNLHYYGEEFMMETPYETSYTDIPFKVAVNSEYNNREILIGKAGAADNIGISSGVRPVIEIKKTRIDY